MCIRDSFNIANTIILFPFANQLVKLSGLFIKEDKGEEKKEDDVEILTRHLDERILETPSFAVENVTLEVVHMRCV